LATSQLWQPTPGENIQQSSDLITRSAANQKRLPWCEPIQGQRLGQCREDRAHRAQNVPDPRRGESWCIRLHRALL